MNRPRISRNDAFAAEARRRPPRPSRIALQRPASGPTSLGVELEELQGVHGLRALRVTVSLKSLDDRPVAAGRLAAVSGGS